jgi:hypothetical protein
MMQGYIVQDVEKIQKNNENMKELHEGKYWVDNMSILDKLMEKKDLAAYIDLRIDYLNVTKTEVIMRQPEKKRGLIQKRFEGRIDELEKLKILLCQNKIKDMGKEYFKQMNKDNIIND